MPQGVGRRSGALALRVATAAVLLAALLVLLFVLPRAWLAGAVALVIALAGHEWARLCDLTGPARWGYAGAMAIGFLAFYGTEPWWPAFAIAAAFWALVAPLWMWRGVAAHQTAGLALAGFAVLLPAGVAMATLPAAELLALLALVWVADTAAYFVGRAWGRRKLAPSISPGKTIEGACGGIAAALAYAIICAAAIGGVRWLPFLALAAMLAALSIVGDLFESAVKRQANVKDSGNLLPGHGGLLDRIDSATATLPVAALALPWVMGAPR